MPRAPKSEVKEESLKTVADAVNTPAADGSDDQADFVQHPGVVVLRVPTDKPGQEDVQIVPIGGMDRLAIPALLQLAVRIDRRSLGLEDS